MVYIAKEEDMKYYWEAALAMIGEDDKDNQPQEQQPEPEKVEDKPQGMV